MDTLERYLDRVIEQKPAAFEAPPEPPSRPGGEPTHDLLAAILRRWYIVLLTFLVVTVIGLPAIWFLIETQHIVTGGIMVAPIIPNILTGQPDRGEISNYTTFVNTQAIMITGDRVVQRVADELVDKDLEFFKDEPISRVGKLKRKLERLRGIKAEPEPVNTLKRAIARGDIRAVARHRTELIAVRMKSMRPSEAKQIVDSFIRNYMAVYVSGSAQEEDQQLAVLENERKVLTERLQRQRQTIRQLADEYGTTTLDGRQDMMLRRVTTLLGELTRLEARRISLEANVELFEQVEQVSISPHELMARRSEYINSDPTIREIIRNIVQLDRDLIVTEQVLAPGNPAIKQKWELLDAFRTRLEEKRQELAKSFDEGLDERAKETAHERLLHSQAEIEQIKVHEKRLREVLSEQDSQTIEVGRTQLDIQDMQFQLELEKDIYDRICRRIKEMEMERKRPARISFAYPADVAFVEDKRVKYSAALVFGAFFCGVVLAFLRDKADKSLHTPDDVVKRIGIRIIGTTTNSRGIKPALLHEQISGDYQTIRANLGLLDSEGIPKKLAVTSPGMREGKTTFAINLATSLAKSGKKVLLIDGDLRKPDVGYLLKISKDKKSLYNVLAGKAVDGAVYSISSSGLDVLAADSHNTSDIYELLASPVAAQQIDKLGFNYDHVIIDTPPVLAFPDALVWAKIAGAVVLISFAGQTTAPDLKKAKERLTEVKTKVLGTILSNVEVDHGYYRYGYDYYSQKAQSVKATRRQRGKKPLLFTEDQPHNVDNSDSQEN